MLIGGKHMTKMTNRQNPKHKPARIHFRRGVYLVSILLIILFAGKLISRNIFTIKGQGVVMFNKFDVKASDDIIIDSFTVSVHDSIEKGDTLFHQRIDCGESPCPPDPSEEKAPHPQDMSGEGTRIMALREYKNRIRDQGFTSGISPLRGYIISIHRKAHTNIKRNDPILEIGLPGTFRIKGFFKQDHHGYLEAGKEVQIVFPDGRSVKGKIVNRHDGPQAIPEKLLRSEDILDRYAVVDIVPFDTNPYMWSGYDMLSVKIIVKR